MSRKKSDKKNPRPKAVYPLIIHQRKKISRLKKKKATRSST